MISLQYIKIAFAQLQELQPNSPEHDTAVRAILERFKVHAQSEEDEELPRLEKAIDHEVSQAAAIAFRKIKKEERVASRN